MIILKLGLLQMMEFYYGISQINNKLKGVDVKTAILTVLVQKRKKLQTVPLCLEKAKKVFPEVFLFT